MGTIWYKPMINSKKLDKFIPLLLVMAIVASLILVPFEKNFSETGTIQGYEKTIFDTKTSLTVNIDIAKENWSDLLANASSKKYYPCDVTINGITYKNVGIRTKGSSSLDDVNLTFKNDRYSLLIKFDKYTKGQNCNGLTKLALNNIIYDATYMKDAIAYDMAHYIGLSAPLTNYANVSINNESMGLYMAVEPVSNSYVARTLGNDKAVVYEPFGSPEYLDDDIDSYTNITTDVKVGKSTKKSKTILRNAIKSVYTGENIEEYVDVENIMKYMALQTVSVNYDSVLGNSGHNYYLYVSNGKIGIIPWDYNLAFGGYTDSDDFDYDALDGFLNLTEEEYEKLSDDELETLEEQAFEAYYNSLSEEEKTKFDEAASFDNAAEANKYVNFPIDSPFSCSLSDRTFFLKLLENETYKEMYYKYLNQLCSYINDGQFDITIQKIDNKIGTTAGMGTTDFYTNTEYKTAISTFKELLKLKSTSILAQLNGKIPTTWDDQETSPDSLIDATHINLKDMGGSFD